MRGQRVSARYYGTTCGNCGAVGASPYRDCGWCGWELPRSVLKPVETTIEPESPPTQPRPAPKLVVIEGGRK